MGQPIEIVGSTVVSDVLVITTDRSVSGQDGAGFDSADAASETDTSPARLARRVFDAVDGVAHVFTGSNTVVIGRDGGWDESTVARAEDVVRRFFVFYDETELEAAGS